MGINFKQIIKFAIIVMIAWYIYTNYIKDKSLTPAVTIQEIEDELSAAGLTPAEVEDELSVTIQEIEDELSAAAVEDDLSAAEVAPFTVIQGGGYPAGGLGGIYRPEGFQNSRPRALGDLGVNRSVRASMEAFQQDVVPRALGNLGAQRTTQVAMDIEGSDQI